MSEIAEIKKNTRRPLGDPLPIPPYKRPQGPQRPRVGLAVESMRRHMTDEGWQIFAGLESASYNLAGYGIDSTNTTRDFYGGTMLDTVLARFNPDTVVMQDKREWEGLTADRNQDPRMRFTQLESLKARDDIFKLTILKDAQNSPLYHRDSAAEIDCHAWVVYYHPEIVAHLAPFVRPQHLVRTYHSIDPALVPPFSPEGRKGALISGALSDAYPLRRSLASNLSLLPDTGRLPHPGYHRNGCQTEEYLKALSRYKVAICTSSRYGYALRKIIEATACGCMVVTDLPRGDALPGIDDNLYRVHSGALPSDVGNLVMRLCRIYNPDLQQQFVDQAKAYYDYRAVGCRLALDRVTLRNHYL